MALFGEDTFQDSDGVALTSHTPDKGTSWVIQAAFGGTAPSIQANKIKGVGVGVWLNSGTPADNFQRVQVDLNVKTLIAGTAYGVVARQDPSNVYSGYWAYYDVDNTRWVLYLLANSTSTLLGNFTQVLTPGQTYRLRFDCFLKKQVYVDDVLVIDIADETIDWLNTTGSKAGVIIIPSGDGNTTGIHLDNFSAATLSHTNFATDAFTGSDGTALTSHTPEFGTAWTGVTIFGTVGTTVTDANRIKGHATNFSIAVIGRQSDWNEYDVQMDIVQKSALSGCSLGVSGRYSNRAVSGYFAMYDNDTGQWQLYKHDDGASTLLGTYTQSLTNNQTYTLKLQIRNATKKVFIDGVERISSNDNSVTCIGNAGIYGGAATGWDNTHGLHGDNFSAKVARTWTLSTATIGSSSAQILVPTAYDAGAGAHVVVWHHGAGITDGTAGLEQNGLGRSHVDALAAEGYIQIGISAGADNWGNQAAIDDYEDIQAYIAGAYNPKKYFFLSGSMGGLTGLLCLARGNFTDVIAWYGIYPVCNLQKEYDLGVFTSAINTAYGISGDYAAKTAGHDPVLKSGTAFGNIFFRASASPDDTYVPQADNWDTFKALIDGHVRENSTLQGVGNHGDVSMHQPQDTIDFYQRALDAEESSTSGNFMGFL